MHAACLMATFNRPFVVDVAINSFLSQTYDKRTLVIIDDSDRNVAPEIPHHPQIVHIQLHRRQTFWEKWNIGIRAVPAEAYLLWDDDDWYASTRIEEQVQHLSSNAACALSNLRFYDVGKRLMWKHLPTHPADVSMSFRREFWEQRPFRGNESMSIGLDHFMRDKSKPFVFPGTHLIVVRRWDHIARSSTCPYCTGTSLFVDISEQIGWMDDPRKDPGYLGYECSQCRRRWFKHNQSSPCLNEDGGFQRLPDEDQWTP